MSGAIVDGVDVPLIAVKSVLEEKQFAIFQDAMKKSNRHLSWLSATHRTLDER